MKMKGYDFRGYYYDPRFMIECQLEKQKWCSTRILGDNFVCLSENWGPL